LGCCSPCSLRLEPSGTNLEKIDGDWSLASFVLFSAVLPPMILFYMAVAQVVAIRSTDGVETAATILGWTSIVWLILYYVLLPRIRRAS
jgi:hypothetical protein